MRNFKEYIFGLAPSLRFGSSCSGFRFAPAILFTSFRGSAKPFPSLTQIAIFLLYLGFFPTQTIAQVVNDSTETDFLSRDTLEVIQSSGVFNVVFSRSYLLLSGFRDDIPMEPALSGNTVFGISLNKVVNKKIGFHFQPVFRTLKLAYKQDLSRAYPNDPDTTLSLQKQRMYYVGSDIGFRYNIKKDDKNRPVTFAEIGLNLGINVGNSEKTLKYFKNEKIKTKNSNIQDINFFYTGSYLKLNYRWLGLYMHYRYSRVFKKGSVYRYDLNDFRENPIFPHWEFGFCLVL